MITSGGRAADGSGIPPALGRLRVALEEVYASASQQVGLTLPQAELLCAALRPTAIGDLAQALHCDRSNVSRLVDRAARRGLLERRVEESDGRMSVVELTARGRRLAERFLKELESKTQPLLVSWSLERQRAATQMLEELASVLEAPLATVSRTPVVHRPAR